MNTHQFHAFVPIATSPDITIRLLGSQLPRLLAPLLPFLLGRLAPDGSKEIAVQIAEPHRETEMRRLGEDLRRPVAVFTDLSPGQ